MSSSSSHGGKGSVWSEWLVLVTWLEAERLLVDSVAMLLSVWSVLCWREW